jgi:hypothetical protein
VWTDAPMGLFAPIGWRVAARTFHADADEWGLRAEVRCVAPDAFAETTDLPLSGLSTSWGDGVTYGTDFLDLDGITHTRALPPGAVGVLGMGARASGSGGVRDLGPAHTDPTPDLVWQAQTHAFRALFDPEMTLTSSALAFGDDFGSVLSECLATIDPSILDRFTVGGEVLFGVVGGGGGVIWLPGDGPIPVDPEPFRAAFDALPVGVAFYEDPRELDARLDEIGAGLDAERVAWTESDDVGTLLRDEGVALIVPRDEADAVAWLSANRRELATRATNAVVFLERGGAGEELLARW